MRSTQELRDLWGPACKSIGRGILEAYIALDLILRKYGYAPRKGVTGAFNCRQITGGAKYSLHAYGPESTFTFWTGVKVAMAIAVDINWDKNPYGPRLVTDMPRAMVDEICALRTLTGHPVWRWGGYYSGNKDAMHFEIVASPSELAAGMRVPPTSHDVDQEDDPMWTLHHAPGLNEAWIIPERSGRVLVHTNHATRIVLVRYTPKAPDGYYYEIHDLPKQTRQPFDVAGDVTGVLVALDSSPSIGVRWQAA